LFAPSLRNIDFAGLKLDTISTYNGFSLFSQEGQEWVQYRTDENNSFHRLLLSSTPSQKELAKRTEYPYAELNNHRSVDLPDESIVDELVSIYDLSYLSLMFPVVDTSLFQETIKTVYQPSHITPPPTSVGAKACVYAFLAFLSFLGFEPKTSPIVESGTYALEVFRILPGLVHEMATLNSLQAVIMLVCDIF
jgi:hypothetical protein